MAARKGPANTGKPKGAKSIRREPLLRLCDDGALTPQHLVLARRLALLGLVDLEIAEAFGVSVRTLNNWKVRWPEFKAALNDGKALADGEVVEALFQLTRNRVVEKAKPLVVDGGVEVVRWTENAEPDFRASSHWLACRRPKEWALNRAKVDAEGDQGEAAARETAVGRGA